MNFNNLILIICSFILISCGSGGSESSSSSEGNNEENNTSFDFEPSCSEPMNIAHAPFHNKGIKSDVEYFLICNTSQLLAINNNSETLGQNYRLGQDIDLFSYYEGDYATNPTNQFMIGGYPNNPFTGLFIGDHWSISNFRYINNNDNNYCGLFSYIKDGSVYGIQLENSRIDNNSDSSVCGPIVGLAENSLVYEIAILKEEENGVPERDWSFVRGTNIAGIIGKMNDTTLYESYSVTELQNVNSGNNFNNFNNSGVSHLIEEGSVLVDLFYDGKIESLLSTSKAGISVNSFISSENSPYLEAVYYSDKIASEACLNDFDCGGEDVYFIDTSSDQYYFMDSRNLPLSNWNPVNWWFADSIENARYPYLD